MLGGVRNIDASAIMNSTLSYGLCLLLRLVAPTYLRRYLDTYCIFCCEIYLYLGCTGSLLLVRTVMEMIARAMMILRQWRGDMIASEFCPWSECGTIQVQYLTKNESYFAGK